MKFQRYECWTVAQDPSEEPGWKDETGSPCRAAEHFVERLWEKGELGGVVLPADDHPEDPEVVAIIGCIVKGEDKRLLRFAVEVWLDSDGPRYPTFQAFEQRTIFAD
jgi:hypothetical protein